MSMNENLNPSSEDFSPEEHDIERALRPLSFGDFAGQDQILENLKVFEMLYIDVWNICNIFIYGK